MDILIPDIGKMEQSLTLNLQEILEIKANFKALLYRNGTIEKDQNGRFYVKGDLIDARISKNQIVDNGHIYVANKLAGKSVPFMRYMAVGTVSGGKNAGSNALENEISRIWMTDYENSGTRILVYRAIFGLGVGTGLLVEAGIFDTSLAGNMLSWADYAVINKTINDILEIQWSHTY